MNTKRMMATAIGLSLINLVVLGIQIIPAVKADVAGMGRYELRGDRDFRRAVEDIVEDCSVDEGSISC